MSGTFPGGPCLDAIRGGQAWNTEGVLRKPGCPVSDPSPVDEPSGREDMHRFHRRIVVLNERFERYLRRVLSREGVDLTLRQWHVLAVLGEHAPMSQRALGEALEQLPSSVSGTVEHLARLDLVTRRPHEVDRRSVEVDLTLQGRSLVDRVNATMEADLLGLEAHYPPSVLGEISRLLDIILSVGPEFPSEQMKTARKKS